MVRSCPKCNFEIIYSTKRGFDVANQRGSKCRTCTDNANIGYKHSELARTKIKRNHPRYWAGKERSEKDRRKMGEKRKGKPAWNSGKRGVYSNETLKKMRLARIADATRKHGQIRPNFNKLACYVIDQFGKKYGYSFRHALNGGEFYIKELGYWVDGYDETRNTVIEYHERRHHNRTHIKQKDKQRRGEIITVLNCRFIILEEQNNADR